MHNIILRSVQRFHSSKFPHRLHADLKSYSFDVSIRSNTDQIAMSCNKQTKDIGTIICQDQNNFSWLHKCAPGFHVNGRNITIIHEPAVFYSTLVEKCKNAKKRITFASLYLGTGPLETELVEVLQDTINLTEGNVKVKILLDYTRGLRGKHNSCSMLQPLLTGKYGQSCEIFLYHTPKLRGFLKAVMPDRFNELIGLQHMKLYMIDDTLIISGANLSNDYFTNRQDRYFMIEDCNELCNFYNDLIKRVGEFSFLLRPDGNVTLSSTLKLHPFKGSKHKFIRTATNSIKRFLQDEIEKSQELHKTDKNFENDTWIFPLLQMGQLNIRHDSRITLKLLQTASSEATIKLATGYFNLTSEYRSAILKNTKANCQLLTAHPTANGFLNAKGVAGGIPAGYTLIEKLFYKACENMNQGKRVTLWEFIKPGWTYHAKGLWYFSPGQQMPGLTLVGSPNFGYRSVNRDLETQIAIVTKNKYLQNALKAEQEHLFSCAVPVTRQTFTEESRVPPLWVAVVVFLFRYYF